MTLENHHFFERRFTSSFMLGIVHCHVSELRGCKYLVPMTVIGPPCGFTDPLGNDHISHQTGKGHVHRLKIVFSGDMLVPRRVSLLPISVLSTRTTGYECKTIKFRTKNVSTYFFGPLSQIEERVNRLTYP